jgi:hypothetical protein
MNKEPLTPRKLLTDMISSDSYRETFDGVNINGLSSDEKLSMRAHGLGAAALQLAQENTRESGYKTLDGHIYTLLAACNSSLAAQQKLDQLRYAKSTREEKIPYLEKVVDFNHTLREVIDAGGSSLTPTSLFSMLGEMYQLMYGPDNVSAFTQELRRKFTGMRHEIGFEQIIANMPDVEYINATPKEEIIDGIDMKIKYMGIILPSDIKASQDSATKAQENDWGKNKLYIWSHLQNQDFGNKFRISNTLAEQKAQEIRPILRDAVTWIEQRAA